MAIFKCKMCGGTIEFEQGESIGTCAYCGTKQTLPRLDDEKRVQLYDRANYFRRANEYDKAMGIYEMIIADEKEDAEAYWGIVLCKYGIEYVEDPRSGKRIPTVNRAQYTSIFDDKDYQSAIAYADDAQKEIYRTEAKTIDTIQKGILEISSKEEPFDVFICYKETGADGERTQDSVLAQDIYKALTKEGYKVFFSRITLESKLGQQYEPYIFAALNSAKVMLAVGTKKEYFEAAWIKNEWSRFLSLMKNDSSKILIPCYKDISPYDMPEEFTYLQSQDIGKIGFMQDLLHGISKVVNKSSTKQTVIVKSGNAEVAPLLKRAFMFLEDGEWQSADEYCERVLDIDPENAEAYLGKLMSNLHIKEKNNLKFAKEPFEQNANCRKASYFDSSIGKKLSEDNTFIRERNAKEKRKKEEEESQLAAVKALKKRKTRKKAVLISVPIVVICVVFAIVLNTVIIPNKEYKSALDLYKAGEYSKAIVAFQSLDGYKDSDKQISRIVQLINENALEHSHFITAGSSHSVAVKEDGTVVAVGWNDLGQCDVSGWNKIIAISSNYHHTVGLKADGTVVATGRNEYGECDISNWDNIAAVSAGGFYTIGLKRNGTVVAVGNNSNGQCNVSDWSDIIAISAGSNHTVGLKSDGTVVATKFFKKWSFDVDEGQCNVSNWKNIIAVDAGINHTIGLKEDGTVVAVGNNDRGQCDVSKWKDIVAVSAGDRYTIGLKKDGTVVAAGNNDGNFLTWKNIIAIATGYDHTIGLRVDGTVVATGDNLNGQCNVSDWKDIRVN